MSCAPEKLGLLLAGALEADEEERLLAHLEGCRDCAIELAALGSLEDELERLAPAPAAAPGARWWLVALAACVAAALVLSWALRADGDRLLSGELLAGATVLGPGALLPPHQPLEARTLSRVRIGDVDLELAGSARIELRPAREIFLAEGEARCLMPVPADTFILSTGLAELWVFEDGERASEEEMRDVGIKLAVAATVVTVVVVSGTVIMKLNGDRAQPEWRLDAGDTAQIRADAGQLAELQDRLVASEDAVVEARAAADAASAEVERARAAETAAAARFEELQADYAALEQRLAAAEQALAAAGQATPPPEVASPEPQPEDGLPFSYGGWGELAELREADWEDLGGAMQALAWDLLPAYLEGVASGNLDRQLAIEVTKENAKLQGLALGLNGKLPTHQSGNGEYTHPIVLANLMAAQLEAMQQPLDAAQLRAIEALGERYDADQARLNASYDASTLTLQKPLDELALKAEFSASLEQLLRAEQRALVIHPEYHHVYGVDLYSPVLMAPVEDLVGASDLDDLREELIDTAAERWSIPRADLEALPAVFQTWVANLGPLEPVPASQKQFFTLSNATLAGAAQLQAMRDLEQLLGLDEEAARPLRDEAGLLVPRLIE